MKWKAKELPKNGDIKVFNRFAFFPTKIDNIWIWFECYTVTEQFFERTTFMSYDEWRVIDITIKGGVNELGHCF